MKKLVALLGVLILPASVQAQAAEATANANANSRVSDTARIESLEARADETDAEQTVQDSRLDALEAGSGASQAPDWTLYTIDPVSGTFTPDPDIHILHYPANQSEATATLLLKITRLTDGKEVWFPGVWAGTNNIVTPTWQGIFAARYNVLGYPAGSGCTGDPTTLITRTNSAGTSLFKTRVALGDRAYDPRTGIVWRSLSGGSTFDGDTYDVYEYGLEKGWLPGRSTRCRTIVVGTTPEYPGSGRTPVFPNPVHYAQTSYIYDGVTAVPSRTIAPSGFFD